jgi:hypothetical protein
MNDELQNLLERFNKLEEFVSGMSSRLIYARGEAMAATFVLGEVVRILSRNNSIEKFSMGVALISADAALDKERSASAPRTQAAIDHARLLLKSMQINLRNSRMSSNGGFNDTSGAAIQTASAESFPAGSIGH